DFNKFLRRSPTATGLSLFVGKLQAGMIAAGKVISSLVGGFNTNEYFVKRAGSKSAPWVPAVFAHILCRDPPAPEVSFNLAQLASGMPRGTLVFNTILSGTEYRTNLINGYYQQLVKRLPTQDELNNLLSQFPTGVINPLGFTDQSAQAIVAATLEYY